MMFNKIGKEVSPDMGCLIESIYALVETTTLLSWPGMMSPSGCSMKISFSRGP
jgi:hypothetical protein